MKVSVIITVYNLERFIVEAIDSVLKQTYKADEIIVVDDGSTDGSLNLIESFGNCIKVFSMGKNSGVLLAFLKGLKESSGDILCFLDGDDIWMPEKLEKVINVFENHSDAMMVTHVHEWIDEEGSSSNVIDNTHRNLKRISAMARTHNEMDRLLKNSILCYKGVWLGSAFCIQKRDLNIEEYEKWVLSYPGSELSHQDQPLAAYLIHANPEKKIYFINDVLFRYRVYSNNSSGSSINRKAALKTVSRSIATVSRTKDIVEQHPSWKEENFNQKMKLLELEFYNDLYSKKRIDAFRSYFRLFFLYWQTQEKIKETKRLVACTLLGPDKFFRIKSKKNFSQ